MRILLIVVIGVCFMCSSGCASTGAHKSTGEMIDDAVLSGKVKSKLIADADVRAFSIDVDTRNGVVILNGRVSSEWEQDRAVEIAESVYGVKEVKSLLVIKE